MSETSYTLSTLHSPLSTLHSPLTTLHSPLSSQIMLLLNEKQVRTKLKRLAIQICERNLSAKKLIFVGINTTGHRIAEMFFNEWQSRLEIEAHLLHLKINPQAPLQNLIHTTYDFKDSKVCNVILVDDVTNTGRTLFYAMTPFITAEYKKFEVAVLVDRKHKSYPIQPDYVGLSLATTLQENILVKFSDEGNCSVYLD